MTITAMQTCAADTLQLFIKTMPDCPFIADDIVIEFAPKAKMAERTHALCEKYVPDKNINDSQASHLVTDTAGNALVGRDKSAVIFCSRIKMSVQEMRCTAFHEFTHIYCAKLEMDGEHFIDIYGSGTTPEREMTSTEMQYDDVLVAGYFVWSEFIAQYYALKHTEQLRPTVKQMSHYIDSLIAEVGHTDNVGEKYAMAFACARLLTCTDAEKQIAYLKENNEDDLPELKALQSCAFFLHEHMQAEKPWKISEDFIAELGQKYLYFKVLNSDLGALMNQFGGGLV
jgi:hypothetical protein